MKKIVGYSDKLSVTPGETITFMVSAIEEPRAFDLRIIRLISGDDNSDEVGFKFDAVGSAIDGAYQADIQRTRSGSHVFVAPSSFGFEKGFTCSFRVFPTRPVGPAEQCLIGWWSDESSSGWRIFLDRAGHLALNIGDGRGRRFELRCPEPMRVREWYSVRASFNAGTGVVRLSQAPRTRRPLLRGTAIEATSAIALPPGDELPLLFGAQHAGGGETRAWSASFNGKIDRPLLLGGAPSDAELERVERAPFQADGLIGAWDFSVGISTEQVHDRSRHGRHGRTVNLPTRAVTGFDWNGECMDWQARPEHYGAIHFHEDDLTDAGWKPTCRYEIPSDLPSGIYAARLTVSGDEDNVVFFVRPAPGGPRLPVAFLASTATYLAYGNNHTAFDSELREMSRGELIKLRKDDIFLNEHREYGLATYDLHADGSGVHYSSRLRPLLNMRPRTYQWSFNADTHLINWFHGENIAHDVITDEDLHREGAALLENYRVVVTGTHPEYYSAAMRAGVETYLAAGGRLMYMGGNGFYWRIAYHPESPAIIEVRRAETGTRAWIAEPGEFYHSFTGEYGGLWLRNGKPPNDLVGVGYIAQGFDRSSPFVRQPDSHDARASWIFEGIEDGPIGDFGLIGGGAAGSEIDCIDHSLGSPPHVLRLASSERHTNVYFAAIENETELTSGLGAPENPRVKADMVFFETLNGGAVWASGSIAWSGALSHNGFNNSVARITRNVLGRFMDPRPFPEPQGPGGERSSSPVSEEPIDGKK